VGRPSFTELLDEKLRETAGATNAAPPITTGPMRAMPPHPLLFAAAYRSVKPAGYAKFDPFRATVHREEFADLDDRRLYADVGRARSPIDDDHQTASHRSGQTPAGSPRHLTSSETQALTILNRLGARLHPDFTHRALRSAYRTLARRLHPDHYANSDSVERTRRSRLFVVATEHHRTLLRVIARETQTVAAGA